MDGVHTEIPIPSSAWDVENETVWLTQAQLAELYKVNVPAVNKQIQNVFEDEELQEDSVISKMEIVQLEGNREVSREVKHYNLEMLIALGYRIRSKAHCIRYDTVGFLFLFMVLFSIHHPTYDISHNCQEGREVKRPKDLKTSKKSNEPLDTFDSVIYVTRITTEPTTVFVSASACNYPFGQGYAH